MVQCYNCSKRAMYAVGPEGHQTPLCLDCYIRWCNVQQRNIENMERMMNYIVDGMRQTQGFMDSIQDFRPANILCIREI